MIEKNPSSEKGRYNKGQYFLDYQSFEILEEISPAPNSPYVNTFYQITITKHSSDNIMRNKEVLRDVRELQGKHSETSGLNNSTFWTWISEIHIIIDIYFFPKKL